MLNFNIVAITDNDKKKHNQLFTGLKVVPPSSIYEIAHDYIIIASTFHFEIKKQLTQEFGISEEKIIYACSLTKSLELWNPPQVNLVQNNSLISNLLNFLPKINRTPFIFHDLDFYGTRESIETKYEINIKPQKNVSWVHGWIYTKLRHPSMLVSDYIIKKHDIALTNTHCERDFLLHNGYRNAHNVGARFLYLKPDLEIQRIKNSVLFMPTHSGNFDNYSNEILNSLKQFSHEFGFDREKSAICLGGYDSMRLSMSNNPFFKKSNIPIITGAWVHDQNSFERMWTIFSLFETIVTDAIGSHIPYGLAAGCKIKISKKLVGLDYSKINMYTKYQQKNKWLFEHYSKSENIDTLRTLIPEIFSENQSSEENINVGQTLLGYESMITTTQLKSIILS